MRSNVKKHLAAFLAEPDEWEFLRSGNKHGNISDRLRSLVRECMERRDPIEVLNELVTRWENGEISNKLFIDRFREISARYKKTSAIYDMAVERVAELENDGIINQALGRDRLQQIDKWIDGK